MVRRSILNYPFAILVVSLYTHIFYETRLYSDALLQVFFFVVNLYGWWYWSRQKQEEGDIRVRVMPSAMRAAVLAICIVSIVGWGALMYRFTDALYPWWDGAIAMLSATAQNLMTRRYIENGILWIGVDILAIRLFAARGPDFRAGRRRPLPLPCDACQTQSAARHMYRAALPHRFARDYLARGAAAAAFSGSPPSWVTSLV